MITNKQTNKQTNEQTSKYIAKTNVIFIVMTTMITSAKMTLFDIMITNKQTNKRTNKQKKTKKKHTNKQRQGQETQFHISLSTQDEKDLGWVDSLSPLFGIVINYFVFCRVSLSSQQHSDTVSVY